MGRKLKQTIERTAACQMEITRKDTIISHIMAARKSTLDMCSHNESTVSINTTTSFEDNYL